MLTPSSLVADSPWPQRLFAVPVGQAALRLVDGAGTADVLSLPVGRWHGTPSVEELAVLARAVDPVLDIGCGPGRHVAALVEAGQIALGIDVSAAAVMAAGRRGAPARRVSVFADVPGAGCWMTALLLDGNIGIGGDPVVLLRRTRALLCPAGIALVEMDPPGVTPGRFHARVEHGGRIGPQFPWARVGPGQIHDFAARAGFDVHDVWHRAGRWFAQLGR